MQFIKDGPIVPERLLQAHEDGQVVFFCGAGISYPAGLPLFKGLVEKIFASLSVTPNGAEKAALDRGMYDTAVSLLEGRLLNGRVVVRQALARVLAPRINKKNATRTHNSLLRLGKCRSGEYRIVTTNFDRLFETVIKKHKLSITSYSAPHLPLPKNHWSGLVYLHGFLPKKPSEDDLHRLVIGSGDFGLAYLVERWGARFVSELFRNYTVCFVGYSIDDPVMRYMVDAVAADKQMGGVPNETFAFGSFKLGQEEEAQQNWASKNVTPILYNESPNHDALHDTLEHWADMFHDGVSAKELIATRYASIEPGTSTKQDDFVRRTLWALSDASGAPAKRFAEYSPVPSLEWLTPFTETKFGHDDLNRFGVTPGKEQDLKLSFSLLFRPTPYQKAAWMFPLVPNLHHSNRLDLVMSEMISWLVRHAGNPKLLLWVVRFGDDLHPVFEQKLRSELEKGTVPAAMATLWELVLAKRTISRRSPPDLYSLIARLKNDKLTFALKSELIEALSPCIEINPSYEHARFSDLKSKTKENENISQMVRGDVEIRAKQTIEALSLVDHFLSHEQVFADLLQDLTKLLLEATELQILVSGNKHSSDFSHLYRPSISDHPQNSGTRNWTILIELTRNAWLSAAEMNKKLASLEVTRWILIPHPIFKRLAFFAAVERSDLTPVNVSLNWLLENDGEWLWRDEARREARLLIRHLSLNLDTPGQNKLLSAILKGPPRHHYNQDMSDESFELRSDREVFLILADLQSHKVNLTSAAVEQMRKIRVSQPHLSLRSDDRDQFLVWTSFGEISSTTAIPTERDEMSKWLMDHPTSDDLHYLDDWADRCENNFADACYALIKISKQNHWPTDRWRQALSVWSSDPLIKKTWRLIAPVLARAPKLVVDQLASPISWWIRAASDLEVRHARLFFVLANRVLDAPAEPSSDWLDDDRLEIALNHPIGLTTEAVVKFWYKKGLNDNEKLRSNVRVFFDRLVSEANPAFLYGIIILSSNLITLFRVDELWTKEKLAPYFNWKENGQNCIPVWQGFLRSPRLYWPLLDHFKSYIIESASYYDSLGEYAEQYASFITYAALQPGGEYTNEDFQEIMERLPASAFLTIIETLVRALESSGDRKAQFYDHRVNPFLQRFWPKTKEYYTPETAQQFAKICVNAGDSFPTAFSSWKVWLAPLSNLDSILYTLDSSNLCDEFPEDCLAFLSEIIPGEIGWAGNQLAVCLKLIIAASPDLERDQSFRRLIVISERR